MRHPEHWRRYTRITASTFGVAAAIVLATGARVAAGNSYDVYACYAGQGTYLNPGDSAVSWALSDNNGSAYYLPFDQCGATDNGFGVISRSGDIAPAGDYGEVSFEAPAGLSISRVQLWRSLYDYGLGSGGTSQRNYAWNLADGNLPGLGDEFEGAEDVPHGAAGSGETTEHGIVPSNYISIDLAASLPHTYAYVIGCSFANGCTTGGHDPVSPSGPDTVLEIYGAIVSVQDNTSPTLSLGSSGLLDGAIQSATVPLTLSAADPAGIAKLALYAGNSMTPSFIQDFTQGTKCQFWEAIPCQNLSSYQLPVNTTQLPNGTYYITVKAYDPAGNVVASSSPSPVTVQNATGATPSSMPIGPGSSLVLRGAANGTNASDQATLTARWAGTSKALGIGRYGSVDRATGRLTAPGNVPISGASIAVYETPAYEGARTVPLKDVDTGPTGTWTLTLPPNVSSSTLSFEYRSHQNDTVAAASARLRLTVHAGIALKIAPRISSVGGTIFFSGVVHGTPIPPGGKQLVLEASSGREWIQFDTIGTNAKGRYRARYRFKFGGPIRYQFRVLSRYEADFPFLTGASNIVAVYER
jgi:hypothetical protein